MTLNELNTWLENNPNVEWAQNDDGTLFFRHTLFDKAHEKLKVTPEALAKLTVQKLEQVLVGGRNVEHITRVTGYFSRVSGWNKGKRGELVDRERVLVG